MDVTDQLRLVGLVITDNLSWRANTDSMIRRAFAKLWILRRLKCLGADSNVLKLVYFRHVRSILEFGVPVWNGSITQLEVKKLERVQRIAVKLIYGNMEKYSKILDKLKMEKLVDRRQRLCLNFAKKAVKHSKFNSWFKQEENTNSGRVLYCETKSRGVKLQKSPIPYLTRLLNANNTN